MPPHGVEPFDQRTQLLGDPLGAIGLVVEDDDRGAAIGGNRPLAHAVDCVLHVETTTAEPADTSADVNGVRIVQLETEITADRRKNRTHAVGLHQRSHTAPLKIDDPRRLEPPNRHRVVDMPERVLIAPENRQLDRDGKVRQQITRRW